MARRKTRKPPYSKPPTDGLTPAKRILNLHSKLNIYLSHGSSTIQIKSLVNCVTADIDFRAVEI